jgi:hypothetical protein
MPALGRRDGPLRPAPATGVGARAGSTGRRRARGQQREEARARGSDTNQSQPTEQRGRGSGRWGRNESSVVAGGRPIFGSERVARGARTGDWWCRAAPRAGEREKCRLVVWLRAPCAHVAPARPPWSRKPPAGFVQELDKKLM